jgi:hypothetical protein
MIENFIFCLLYHIFGDLSEELALALGGTGFWDHSEPKKSSPAKPRVEQQKYLRARTNLLS